MPEERLEITIGTVEGLERAVNELERARSAWSTAERSIEAAAARAIAATAGARTALRGLAGRTDVLSRRALAGLDRLERAIGVDASRELGTERARETIETVQGGATGIRTGLAIPSPHPVVSLVAAIGLGTAGALLGGTQGARRADLEQRLRRLELDRDLLATRLAAIERAAETRRQAAARTFRESVARRAVERRRLPRRLAAGPP